MRLTLLESDRSFLRSAECASVSIVAHAALVWLAVASTGAAAGSRPTSARPGCSSSSRPTGWTRRMRQTDDHPVGQARRPSSRAGPACGRGRGPAPGGPAMAPAAGATGAAPAATCPSAPPPSCPDTAFSVLEVDEMVERYEGSAAPVYPPELIARGTEGQVQATYVVDTTGRVDTTTIQVIQSDDPRFTESVRTALGETRFRPAKRGGKPVRQLVQQRFRFRSLPSSQTASQHG